MVVETHVPEVLREAGPEVSVLDFKKYNDSSNECLSYTLPYVGPTRGPDSSDK